MVIPAMETSRNAPIAPVPARPADLEALLTLLQRSDPGLEPSPAFRAHLAARLAQGDVFVLRAGAQLAASVRVSTQGPNFWGERRRDPGAGYIAMLDRDPGLTAPGTGAQLLAWAEARIAEGGRHLARLDTLSTVPRLLRYYAGHAYHQVGSVEVDGTAFTLFEKSLA